MENEDRFYKLKDLILEVYKSEFPEIYCDLQPKIIGFRIDEKDKYFTAFLALYKEVPCVTLRHNLLSYAVERVFIDGKTDSELIGLIRNCIIEQKNKYKLYGQNLPKRRLTEKKEVKVKKKSIEIPIEIKTVAGRSMSTVTQNTEKEKTIFKAHTQEKVKLLLKESLIKVENIVINPFPDEEDIEEYKIWAIEVGEKIQSLVHQRVSGREKRIFDLRMGFDDKNEVTLDYIGQREGVTRERIRQLLNRTALKSNNTVSSFLIECFNSISANDFFNVLHYGFNEEFNHNFTKLIFRFIYGKGKHENYYNIFLKERDNALKEYRKKIQLENKSENIWLKLQKCIVFPEKKIDARKIFDSLKKQRDTNKEFNSGTISSRFGALAFESYQEENLLNIFLSCDRICGIKTQSLIIQYEFNGTKHYYFPDVALLLEDNSMVVIEVKSNVDMVDRKVLMKYNALRAACSKQGFGYAMMDERMHDIIHYSTTNVNMDVVNKFAEYIRNKKSIGINAFNAFRKSCFINVHETIRTVLENKDIAFCRRPFRFYVCKNKSMV